MKSQSTWGDGPTQFFFELTPDRVMTAMESVEFLGSRWQCTGFVVPLASFENRVYEIEIENDQGQKRRVVAKFYRPGRWNEAQIQDEHDFMRDLEAGEVPVVRPYPVASGGSTFFKTNEGLFTCIYPKVGGRPPGDLTPEYRRRLGRLIARMHIIAVQKDAPHRLRFTPENWIRSNFDFLSLEGLLPEVVDGRLFDLSEDLFEIADEVLQGIPIHRLHGDCHAGNILWDEKEGPRFLDFDDMVVGPAIQDLWILADEPEALSDLVEGYQELRDLPKNSLRCVEVLRAMRMLNYLGWIAKRREDPAFQRAFPDFGTEAYFLRWLQDFQEQMDRVYPLVDFSRD